MSCDISIPASLSFNQKVKFSVEKLPLPGVNPKILAFAMQPVCYLFGIPLAGIGLDQVLRSGKL